MASDEEETRDEIEGDVKSRQREGDDNEGYVEEAHIVHPLRFARRRPTQMGRSVVSDDVFRPEDGPIQRLIYLVVHKARHPSHVPLVPSHATTCKQLNGHCRRGISFYINSTYLESKKIL